MAGSECVRLHDVWAQHSERLGRLSSSGFWGFPDWISAVNHACSPQARQRLKAREQTFPAIPNIQGSGRRPFVLGRWKIKRASLAFRCRLLRFHFLFSFQEHRFFKNEDHTSLRKYSDFSQVRFQSRTRTNVRVDSCQKSKFRTSTGCTVAGVTHTWA